MKEKELEKYTGLSRRQIIQLQKRVIKRRNKCTIGIAYEYNDEEIEEFLIAKFLKDCGYSYNEIRNSLILYSKNPEIVIKDALTQMEKEIKRMKENINIGKDFLKSLKKKEEIWKNYHIYY